MLLLFVCVGLLILGYLMYSRLAERAFLPFRDDTPAVTINDGMDYVPMSKWKDHLIQLLNIAGTGPIFGALMGAKWGPIVLIWIVGGTILGGAVHDYMSGMMSERNEGHSATWLIKRYLGEWIRYPILILMVFLMVMVSATFARSASDLLFSITGLPVMLWIAIILVYFALSALLPINKLIGRIYPVFGVLLIIMALTVIAGLAVGGYEFPSMTLENLHPNGDGFYPDMFITVACGAISGFHATQSPMVSRCLRDERDGRMVFYGAMVVEAVIAAIWALAGLAFYHGTVDLAAAFGDGGASTVVYDIATGVAGTVGGVLAIIGVMICPITSGDTALRSARMMIQDDRGYDHSDMRMTMTLTFIMMGFIILLCMLDFSVLWSYFSWLNQTLACVMLWAATAYLLSSPGKSRYSLMTALPAVFMTMVVASFILHSSLGMGLDMTFAIPIAALITVAVAILYIRCWVKASKVSGTV